MCDVEANISGCKVGIGNPADYDMVKFEESDLEVLMSLEASLCNIA